MLMSRANTETEHNNHTCSDTFVTIFELSGVVPEFWSCSAAETAEDADMVAT